MSPSRQTMQGQPGRISRVVPSAMPFLCGALPAAQSSAVPGLRYPDPRAPVLLCWQQAPTMLGQALHPDSGSALQDGLSSRVWLRAGASSSP